MKPCQKCGLDMPLDRERCPECGTRQSRFADRLREAVTKSLARKGKPVRRSFTSVRTVRKAIISGQLPLLADTGRRDSS